MVERKGGYLRPTVSNYVSANYANHRWGRTPPSTEPGTDYGVAYGSQVFASEDGYVYQVDHSTAGAEGRRVSIAHPDGQMTSSIHLSRILVNSGQKVKRGQLIAYSGASAWGREWGVGAHVHHTLFPQHALIYGTTRTIDFQTQEGADNDGVLGLPAGGLKYSQTVANQQNWMNSRRGDIGTEKLVVDGLAGPAYRRAVRKYQTYLKVTSDGIWGSGTQKAHQAYYNRVTKKPIPIVHHKGTTKDAARLKNVHGLQMVANLYLKQKIDNQWGKNSNKGLQLFLNQNYGGSLPAWLRAKWGYVGNDAWGPQMKAALERANHGNWLALK